MSKKLKSKSHSKSPIDTKRSMHLVFKSEMAYGIRSLLHRKNQQFIKSLLGSSAKKYDFKIYNFANVSNHLHLVVRAKDREKFVNFLRSFSSKIAIFITGAKKGAGKGGFWTSTVFLRPISWGKDYSYVMFYVLENALTGVYFEKQGAQFFSSG